MSPVSKVANFNEFRRITADHSRSLWRRYINANMFLQPITVAARSKA
jgi:hypothetical protein